MSRFTIKVVTSIFAVVLIAFGVVMFLHPVASDYFDGGSKYARPHFVHLAESNIKVLGVIMGIFGLGLLYLVFSKLRK